MKIARITSATAMLGAVLMLGGCIGSLVGGGKPDTLYRFGDFDDASAIVQPGLARRTLLLTPASFPAAVAGDRLLTVEGNEVAYLKDVRWASPAPILFRDALTRAFQRRAPDIVLADRTTAGAAQAVLTVDVNKFEAAYENGPDAPPVIHVSGSSAIVGADRALLGRHAFTHALPASANTTSAVAAAIDVASRDSIVELVDWVSTVLPVKPSPPRQASDRPVAGVR